MSNNTTYWPPRTYPLDDGTTSVYYPARAADDYDTIRKRLRRYRVEEACIQAGLTSGTIPDSILLAAGYSAEEIATMGTQRTLPLNDTDLLL